MKLLFVGDIVGRPGRDLVRRHIRALAASCEADFVIANGENAAGGAGITRENMYEILTAGVDVITTGNHVWDKRETLEFIGGEPRLIRPANYPEGTPGAGACVMAAPNGVRVASICFVDTKRDGYTHFPVMEHSSLAGAESFDGRQDVTHRDAVPRDRLAVGLDGQNWLARDLLREDVRSARNGFDDSLNFLRLRSEGLEVVAKELDAHI